MKYTLPKLYIPKSGNEWYVYFTAEDPKTGKMKMVKERRGLNRIKNKKKRKEEFQLLIASLTNDLKEGWSPFIQEQQYDPNRDDFYWWFDERLKLSKQRDGYYNLRKLQGVKNKLQEYAPSLSIHQIDHNFIQGFETWMLDKDLHVNTVADVLTRIKIIVNDVVKSGAIKYHQNPFINYKIKKQDTERRRLGIDDIMMLQNKKMSGNLDLARDMYIFSFYGGGVRFGDLCRLTSDNIKAGYLEYRMNKTKIDKYVLLMEPALKIAKKYMKHKGERLFPVNIDWSMPDKSINSKNSLLNKYLKDACAEAEIPEVTFHTSRHSFADFATHNDIPDKTLMQLLGHKKIQTTEIYRKSFTKEKTDEAIKKLFNK